MLRRTVVGTAIVVLFGVILAAATFEAQPRKGGMTLHVRAYDHAQARGKATLSARAEPCQLAWIGRDDRPSCAVTLAADATTVTMVGEYSADRGRGMQKGTTQWQVVDMGPVIRHLRDRTRPMGDRFRDSAREKAAFEERHAAAVEVFPLEHDPPESQSAIAAAEKRLRFALPAEHRHLLSTVGPIALGDSSMTPAADLKRRYAVLNEDWDMAKADLDKAFNKSTRAVVDESTVLFTQVGDGYGGLLYRPAGEAMCGGGPAYYWIHQDVIEEPELLRGDGGGCAD